MILIINNYQDYPAILNLREALDKCGQTYRIKGGADSIDVDELELYDGIILSGGPGHVNAPMDFEAFKLNFKVMIYAKVPIYGICFGHQIMAKAAGVEIGGWEEARQYKRRRITILDNRGLFEGFDKGDTIKALVSHKDYVADIPSNATLTATAGRATASQIGDEVEATVEQLLGKEGATLLETASWLEVPTKIQALAYRDRPFYSTQFHPETSDEDGLKIIRNFIKLCER